MKLMMTVLILFVLLVLAAMAYVRFTPVADTAAGPRPAAALPGDYPSAGGFYAVRTLAELPEDVLVKLDQVIMNGPRVMRRSGGPDNLPMIYETRSRLWAFPDINTVWVEDGNLHLYANLVYGKSDLGANRARILGWLERL
ncbi:DUF1499 domain-containing protein [Shimia ponticola]|uniref:DUF1499 domain-containing protein n=1 Tax=Shimia ponticola TaxID=2582893 RepID=UPI0011BD59E9|nr:DUF1499 domain-containing protein [Shimia ponticola]